MKRRTKLIATLGPASWSPKKIIKLITAGVNIFRLNFSHGTPKEHGELIKLIRKISKDIDRPVGILADLPGPKLRVGEFENGDPIFLGNGKTCILTTRKVLGNVNEIPLRFEKLPSLVAKGDRILLADGKLELKVQKIKGEDIHCKITVGGELKENQGINVPGKKLDIPAFTFRDQRAVELLEKIKVDYIALSFVQTEADIEKARKEMRKRNIEVPIIAKIEKPEALKRIDSIMDLVDGVMIARGDLGVELPTEDIPVIQKKLIRLAAHKFKPVITATQMLESMTYNSRPTRAEATDVANAIWDGTDAVMLSGETASGKYPIQSVKTMVKIIKKAEENPEFMWDPSLDLPSNPQHSVLKAVAQLADPKRHKAIITFTETGNTAVMLAKMRPQVPIYAVTPVKETREKMSLVWGVRAFYAPRGKTADEMIQIGDKVLQDAGYIKKNDWVIIAAGTRLTSGATNMMKVHRVGDYSAK